MTDARVLAVLVAGTIVPGAAAQRPYAVADGFADSVRVAWTTATTRCVTPLRTGFAIPAADSSCRVVGVTSLGSTGDLDWRLARYRRRVILADTGFADTMDLDELVLLARGRDAAAAHVAWHLVRDRDFEFLDTLVWVPTSHGLFLALGLCLNGTGGCGTEYLRWDGDRWRAIAQPFARDLQARLPPDHWLHKGRQLDLETLAGVWPVAAPGDANCCPSLELPFTLQLADDALTLRSAGPLRSESSRRQ